MQPELRGDLWPEYAKTQNVALRGPQFSANDWAVAREAFYANYGTIPAPAHDLERLESIRDEYKGERIFVIGNGPSLASTPLEFFEDEFTFGVNRIYLMEEALGWSPDFFTVVDWRVAADCVDEIASLQNRRMFIPERFRGMLEPTNDDLYWYHHNGHASKDRAHFSPNASEGIRGAGSVIGSAVQLAFHMGFDPIYLVGCDVSYTVPDTVTQSGPDKFGTGVLLHLESTEDDDPNHFDPRYFGAGRKWHDPNVPRMLEGYAACDAGVSSRGRSLFNATVGGKLETSPRVNVHSLLRAGHTASEPGDMTAALQLLDLVAGAGSEPSATAETATEPASVLVCGGHNAGVVDRLTQTDRVVYVLEPSAEVRRALREAVGPRVGLRIDARFVGPESLDQVTTYSHPEMPGLSSIALSDDAQDEPAEPMVNIADLCEFRRLVKPTAAWIGCGANTIDVIEQFGDGSAVSFLMVEAGSGTGPEFGSVTAELVAVAARLGLGLLTACDVGDGTLRVTNGLIDTAIDGTVKYWICAAQGAIDQALAQGDFVTEPRRVEPLANTAMLSSMAAKEAADRLARL